MIASPDMRTLTGMQESSVDTQILVIGGGVVGLTFAVALAQAGVATCVVDRGSPAAMVAAPFDGRSWAIAYGSMQILDRSGVWARAASLAEPIREIRVADNNAPLFLHYDHQEVGDRPFGWIIESRHLRAALQARAAELPMLTQLAPAEIASITRSKEGVTARLSDGRMIRGDLVVAADGRGSSLRREAGLRSLDHRYGQDAITLTVAHERPHLGIAVEHFLPAGPFAILPMRDDDAATSPALTHRSSVVWTERTAIAEEMMKLDAAAFLGELERRFGDFLGKIRPIGRRFHHPLSVSYAPKLIAERLALIGDAAHAIHPIAGQGLNLGIRGTAILADIIIEACRLGLDPGTPDRLAAYQRQRRFDITALTAVTDVLNRLFSNDLAPLKMVRDLGLVLVGTPPLKPLRQLLMRHAMGLPMRGL